LLIKASGSTVRGLAIGNFRGGAGISLTNSDNNTIQGNYIGIAADGTTARPNQRGIIITTSSNNVIGGTTAATRNVISGNVSEAIEIGGNANVVQGNFIGTNAAGTAEVHNSGGITIFNAAPLNNVIGGTAAGAGNLISGNQGFGIIANGTGTTIQGNLIGTDVTGTKRLQNSAGVIVNGQNILVGGVIAAARNVISGNSGEGVNIRGTGSKLQGNYIGTDITGTLALGNFGSGVSAAESVLIGGTEPGMRNIISANGSSGNVVLGFNNSGSVVVQGNYIGPDVTGTRSLGGPTPGVNIVAGNHTIGGAVAGAGNVISGNTMGIQLGGFFSGAVSNVIQGNLIGLNAAGNGPLPNLLQGIAINDSVNNTIGGTQAEAANKIAFNGAGGITITGNGQGNSIRGNSIFSNNGLGIDLGANGVTANDGSDPDTGPNNLQNFPVITGVLSSASSTTIQGTLKSLPNTTFQIDFYSNRSADPSGNGEGAQFFNSTPVNTDNNGDATISVTFPVELPAGRIITATAIDPNGNTSEFSAADSTGAAGSVQFTASTMGANEDIGTLSITVVRTGGTTGDVSVDFSTTDGTAIAGQDYTATSGTLTFTGGETTRTIQIPITDDSTTEGPETFTVSLRSNTNIEQLGAPGSLTVTLQDHGTAPVITINNVSVFEGDTGSTTEALFIIQLSAATSRAVSFNFATVNQSSVGGSKCGNAGVDYETASGSLSFSPTITAFAIPIKVCGDNNAESNESFRIGLSNVSGAAVQVNSGFAAILDDDELELALEENGPIPNLALAIDALLAVREPFRIEGIPDWYTTVPDKNTRVAFFVRGLQLDPGELPSSVGVFFVQNFGPSRFLLAEDVRPIPNTEFTQVVVKLPSNMPVATYSAQIVAHSRGSNFGVVRIIP
jgi:Calx-beta domain